MAHDIVWKIFRKFRLVVLGLASVLSLILCIIIAVYVADNWSSYDSALRGVFLGLIAIDFIGWILLYLMIVVQYHFWLDAARAAALSGLHLAASVYLVIRNSSLTCSAFGSTANCHKVTLIVIIGSWVISGLLTTYTVCLLVMACIPRPQSAPQKVDLENPPNAREIGEEARESHVSSGSIAWLLKNQEGMSPEAHPSELPTPPGMPAARRTYSDASSSSSLPSPHEDHIELEAVNPASVYSDPSWSSYAEYIHSRDNASKGLKSSSSFSSARYPSRSDSIPLSPLANRFAGEPLDSNRISVASNSYESTYEFPVIPPTIAEAPHRTTSLSTGNSVSVYSQSTARARSPPVSNIGRRNTDTSRVPRRSPTAPALMPDYPGRLSVHSVMASDHSHAEPQSAGASGFWSPPPTALPTPRFSAGPRQSSFDLHYSGLQQRESEEDADLVTMHGTVQRSPSARPSLNHARTDSTTSDVDLNEWKRLVLAAAGR